MICNAINYERLSLFPFDQRGHVSVELMPQLADDQRLTVLCAKDTVHERIAVRVSHCRISLFVIRPYGTGHTPAPSAVPSDESLG